MRRSARQSLPSFCVPSVLLNPQVWICPLSEDAWNPVDVETWLDEQERVRYQGFGHPLPARRFLLGRAILKSTLGRLLGKRPWDITLAYSPNGKPGLAGEARFHFSISHCASAVAVVVAPAAIGMDLEEVQRPRQPWKRPEWFLHPNEAERVKALPLEEQAQAFSVRWTCQEAAIKLLDSSVFDPGSRTLFGEFMRTGTCGGQKLHFASWRVCADTGTGVSVEAAGSARSGLMLSLASLAELEDVEFHHWVS